MNDQLSMPGDGEANAVERTSQTVDKALEATRRAAGLAIDAVANKVHGLQDVMAPTLDRAIAPLDAVGQYTQEAPLKALIAAAAVGAILMALITLMTRSRP